MKDPAALLYIDTWLSSTAGMDADCRGWYLNLLLHQYDKGELPNDIETLAVLANVKFSEFERFKQVFEQVLKQKFIQNEKGNLENPNASEIIRKRQTFKEKRTTSGTIGYIVKVAKEISTKEGYINFVKDNIDLEKTDIKNKQVLKQVLKQMFKLYINGDGDENKDIDKGEILEKYPFENFWNLYEKKGNRKTSLSRWQKLPDKTKEKIMQHVPIYVKATPEKQFRKNAETYLNQEVWNDEIIKSKRQIKNNFSQGFI
jgi:hypothetical protein